ncbi:hypothetical protein BC830DRAFT_1158195, partial [Chytriomyces sp. MP71]
QGHRLRWKLELIDSAKRRLNAPAQPDLDFTDLQFTKVSLKGSFVPGSDIYVGPRTRGAAGGPDTGGGLGGGRPAGYFVYSPFDVVTDQGKKLRVLINGVLEIEAVLRRSEDPNNFPKNDPRANQWYSIDADGMCKWTKSDPILLDLVSNSEVNRPLLERPGAPLARNGTAIHLKNDHFAYAVTWFGMCAITTVLIRNMGRGTGGLKSVGAVGAGQRKYYNNCKRVHTIFSTWCQHISSTRLRTSGALAPSALLTKVTDINYTSYFLDDLGRVIHLRLVSPSS